VSQALSHLATGAALWMLVRALRVPELLTSLLRPVIKRTIERD